MKRLVVALSLAAVACHSATDNSGSDNSTSASANAAEAVPIGQMLKAGQPEACAHPAVKERWLQVMHAEADRDTPDDYPSQGLTAADFEQAKQMVGEPKFTDFQALASNKDIGEVTCGVNVDVGSERGPVSITYILRPSLEKEDDFLVAYPHGGPDALLRVAIAGKAIELAASRKPAQAAAEPDHADANVSGM
ncbi:hypothetical protein [Sphingomonas sp.]|uniref:hypothetical protein n=1 Tax=Sphingomonas sp. TaxID=28214 RepID=UPI0038AD17EF